MKNSLPSFGCLTGASGDTGQFRSGQDIPKVEHSKLFGGNVGFNSSSIEVLYLAHLGLAVRPQSRSLPV